MISETELKQVAYVFKCNNSTLQIKGKINSITLGIQHCSCFTRTFSPQRSCLRICSTKKSIDLYRFTHVTFSADNCKKLGLVFENVVGIVEMINCKDVKVQVSICIYSSKSKKEAHLVRAVSCNTFIH